MYKTRNTFVFLIFKILFLLSCLIIHKDHIHIYGTDKHAVINITVSDANITITDVDVDYPLEKPADPERIKNCLFIINVLESLVHADNLGILDKIVYNTRIAWVVFGQINKHNDSIGQKIPDLETKITQTTLDKNEYLQILEILKEIIKLNGVYVVPDNDNNDTIKLIHSHDYVWEKFIELVMVRKYAVLLQKEKNLQERNGVHSYMKNKIHALYRNKNNDVFVYKNNINSDIIRNLFTDNTQFKGIEDKQIRSLQIHHIWPKCLCGASIFANYVILGSANHLLIHVVEIYQKLEEQESLNKLQGIKNTITQLSNKISKLTNSLNTHIEQQLEKSYYRKMAALTSATKETKVIIKYKQNSNENQIQISL